MSSFKQTHVGAQALMEPPRSSTLAPAGIHRCEEGMPEISHASELYSSGGFRETFEDIGIPGVQEWRICTVKRSKSSSSRFRVSYRSWVSTWAHVGEGSTHEEEPAGGGSSVDRASCGRRSLRAEVASLWARLGSIKRRRCEAVSAVEPGCVAECQSAPDAGAAGLLASSAARSLAQWVAGHEQAATAGRLLTPPLDLLEGRDVDEVYRVALGALATRATDSHVAARAIQQLGLWLSDMQEHPKADSSDMLTAGVAGSMMDLLLQFGEAAGDIVRGEAVFLQWLSGAWTPPGDTQGGAALWHWHAALLGLLVSTGLVDCGVFGRCVASVLTAEASVPAVLMCPLLPVLRLLVSHRGISQSLCLDSAAVLLRLLSSAQALLPPGCPISQSGGPEGPRLAHALEEASAAAVSQLHLHLAQSCADAILLLADMLAACPVTYAGSHELQPAVDLLACPALLHAVDALHGGPPRAAKIRRALRAVSEVYMEAAKLTAVRTNTDLAAAHAIDAAVPDEAAAAEALLQLQAQQRVKPANVVSQPIAWTCAWACGGLVCGTVPGWPCSEEAEKAPPPASKSSLAPETRERCLFGIRVLLSLRLASDEDGLATKDSPEAEMSTRQTFEDALLAWVLDPPDTPRSQILLHFSHELIIAGLVPWLDCLQPCWHARSQPPTPAFSGPGRQRLLGELVPQLSICLSASCKASAKILHTRDGHAAAQPGAGVSLQAWWAHCQRYQHQDHTRWLMAAHVSTASAPPPVSPVHSAQLARMPSRTPSAGSSMEAHVPQPIVAPLAYSVPLGRRLEQAARHAANAMDAQIECTPESFQALLEGCERLRAWQAHVLTRWLVTHLSCTAPLPSLQRALRSAACADLCAAVSAGAGSAGAAVAAPAPRMTVAKMAGLLSSGSAGGTGPQPAGCVEAARGGRWMQHLLALLGSLRGDTTAVCMVAALVLSASQSPRADGVHPVWAAHLLAAVRALSGFIRALGWATAVAKATASLAVRSPLVADTADTILLLLSGQPEQIAAVCAAVQAAPGCDEVATLLLRGRDSAAVQDQGLATGATVAFTEAQGPVGTLVGAAHDAGSVAAALEGLVAGAPVDTALPRAVSYVVTACGRGSGAARETWMASRKGTLLCGLLAWMLEGSGTGISAHALSGQASAPLVRATLEIMTGDGAAAAEGLVSTLWEACALGILDAALALRACMSEEQYSLARRCTLLRHLLARPKCTDAPAAYVLTQRLAASLPAGSFRDLFGARVGGERALLHAALYPVPSSPDDRAAGALVHTLSHNPTTRGALARALPTLQGAPFFKDGAPRCHGPRGCTEWSCALVAWPGAQGAPASRAEEHWQVQLARIVSGSGIGGHAFAEYAAQVALRREGAGSGGGNVPGAAGAQGPGAEQLAQALVAALLRSPHCGPVAVAVAAAAGDSTCRGLLSALLSGVQSRGADGGAAVLLGTKPLHAALRDGLSPALRAYLEDVGPSRRLQRAYVEAHLQVLCRMDHVVWRERAEGLVTQLQLQSDAAAAAAGHAAPSAAARPAPGHIAGGVQSRAGFRAALWTRLQLLMPLLPIIYNDRSTLPSRNLRQRAAAACVRALVHSHVFTPGTEGRPPEPDARRAPDGAPTDALVDLLLLLLHTLVSAQWATYVTCHNDKGRPQPVGEVLDPLALAALAQEAQVPASLRHALNSALLYDLAPVVATLAQKADVPGSPSGGGQARRPMRDPWHWARGLEDSEVWNADDSVFERPGSHEALAGAPRMPRCPPRFGFLA